MVGVLLLFLLPVGGGIPAGVLLARSQGLDGPLTAGLYFLSDLILALVFEPLVRLLMAWGSRIPRVARVAQALSAAVVSSCDRFGGAGAGPLTLILVSFGLDPMTGRVSALAAGHGFLTGWLFAITGDMLYFGVVAAATLQLNTHLRHPELTIAIMLGLMILLPMLVSTLRRRKGSTFPRS